MRILFKLLCTFLLACILLLAVTDPTPPSTFLDTHYITPTGTSRAVHSGDAFSVLQAAVDASVGSDEVVLDAGAKWVGNLTLRVHSGSSCVVIRSSELSSLPEGTRVTASASHMATIATATVAPAIDTDAGANCWRIAGIELTVDTGNVVNSGLALGYAGNGAETMTSQLPIDITFDRSWIHGSTTCACKRGVTFNGRRLAVVDSYISDIHVDGQDTQAIGGWNGTGPYKIANNELQGAGENVMFGGQDSNGGWVASDIEVRRNHFFKPLTWNPNDMVNYAGLHWTVKNLFEIKNGQRIIIDGNIFENSWIDGQDGVAISFKSSNQNDGMGCPQCTGSDILFSNNIIKNADQGILFDGQEVGGASGSHNPPQKPTPSVRIKVSNVLIVLRPMTGTPLTDCISGSAGCNHLFSFVTQPQIYTYSPPLVLTSDVQFIHVTGIYGQAIAATPTELGTNFLARDSIWDRLTYGLGVAGNEGSAGYACGPCFLGGWYTPYTWTDMMLLNNTTSSVTNAYLSGAYPATTQVVTGYVGAGFVNYGALGSDYHNLALTSMSPGHLAASDSKDLGVDFTALDAALSGGGGVLPTITTSCPLPGGIRNVSYSSTLTASGDTPFTWTISSGSLPAGLSLTGAVISGTPIGIGLASFTIQASNSTGTATNGPLSCSIGISSGVRLSGGSRKSGPSR